MILTRPNSAIADMVEATYRKRRSFVAGFTLTNAREVLLYDVDGNYYQWKGTLPKVVPANSTPASSGGISATAWVNVGKADDIAVINAKFTVIQQEIDDLATSIPDAGKSAYDIAVENGFVGSETEWLASLKGDPGAPLNLLGSKASTGELPMIGNTAGDAWIINEDMWAWDGSAWKKINSQGPQGKSAYEVWLDAGNTGTEIDYLAYIKGDKGDPGPEGKQGTPGANANGFDYQGMIDDPAFLPLPSPSNVSQAWSYGTYLYVSNGSMWVNMGNIVGPQGNKGDKGDEGESAYEIWLEEGYIGTEADFLAWLKGEQGEQGPKGDQGDQGTQGIQGPPGEGLNIVDIIDNESELPESAKAGTGYLVGPNEYLYVWIPTNPDDATIGTWENVGILNGISITAQGQIPNGGALPPTADYGAAYMTQDTGSLYIYTRNFDDTEGWVDMGSLKGNDGEKGDKGDKGDDGTDGTNGTNGTDGADGTKWFVAPTDPSNASGAVDDYAFNTATGDVFRKTGALTWTLIGTLPSLPEAPEDGKQYARKDGAWVEVVVPDLSGSEITPDTVSANYVEVTAYTNASTTGTWTPPGDRNMHILTLTGATAIAAWPGVTSGTKPKPFSAMIYLIQDATGSRSVSLDTSYKILNTASIGTDPGAVTILQLTYCGVGDFVDVVIANRT